MLPHTLALGAGHVPMLLHLLAAPAARPAARAARCIGRAGHNGPPARHVVAAACSCIHALAAHPPLCTCRLPTPRPGQVLGLVGSNGTGEQRYRCAVLRCATLCRAVTSCCCLYEHRAVPATQHRLVGSSPPVCDSRCPLKQCSPALLTTIPAAGKSTALKILAGKLKPNLGRFDVRALPCCAMPCCAVLPCCAVHALPLCLLCLVGFRRCAAGACCACACLAWGCGPAHHLLLLPSYQSERVR